MTQTRILHVPPVRIIPEGDDSNLPPILKPEFGEEGRPHTDMLELALQEWSALND